MTGNVCYLCGSSQATVRPGAVRDNAALQVMECGRCGLVYLSRRDHITGSFYADSKMHVNESTAPDSAQWLRDADADDARRAQFVADIIARRTVLDFGCGAAGFALKVRDRYARITGIEPEKRLQDHFAANGVEVYPDLSALTTADPERRFDVITMFHVLEHLSDPRAVLRELSPLLNSGDRIVIEVPHASDALLTLYKSDAFSRFTYWSCHLFLFTRDTLATLAEQSGLKVQYIDQVQRYPLSNHLFWLAQGKPGGHQQWAFLNDDALHAAYERRLADAGICDTLIASLCL